jgi:hypothetical protein
MMAPPIPYGHYAKDGLLGCASCRMHNLLGCHGCGHDGHGHGSAHGDVCGACGGKGCALCGGFGHGGGDAGCVGPGCGGLHGHKWHHHKSGKFAPCDTCVGQVAAVEAGPAGAMATSQVLPAGQAVVTPSGQSPCGLKGCGLKNAHSHHGKRCGRCLGKGCRHCGGDGLAGCGDPGCGLCHGKGGKGCGFCGGKGCSHCLAGLHSKLAGLFNHQKVEYFVGPGGPVPLTPGYVPYIVPTRSPRDYFSFPPMNPFDP